MEPFHELVLRAQGGDVEAFGQLVHYTQKMAYAVARSIPPRFSPIRRARRSALALLTLSTEERQICDRRYHGG
jgi:hypothetical protein